ncbi:elongation factor P [Nitrosomonas sp.]|uniref:elongation factor P n=1 Tax=Nitrosomonas sp. TaxID=42353 RepID=UPI001D585077|nr:elongation factor P [Nitrosomonas sp.]MCB1947594.1 elongation factor P [Nitrosomonas sp.]MCP5242272.1 elongation factor P [Burkholderiales bacterium]MDR4514146.1 elongation factor P [Nitrosomonas sp.]
MKISAFEVRVGNLVEYQNKLWKVYKKNHVKPGKGGAFVQLEMKAVIDGTKLNERFRSEDKVEKAHVEPRQMQYLYAEGDSYVFMDNESFEQLTVPIEELEEQAPYLLPNTDVQINFYNDSPIGLELPTSVVLEVTETEVMMKGQTAASGGKPAVLETGLKVTVPQFVNVGDKIKVNTDTGEYVERV